MHSANQVVLDSLEGTVERLAVGIGSLVGPLLGLWVEVRVSPKSVHHLAFVDTELLGVSGSEVSERESPTVKTRSEGDSALFRVDLEVTESFVVVCRNDDVDCMKSKMSGQMNLCI